MLCSNDPAARGRLAVGDEETVNRSCNWPRWWKLPAGKRSRVFDPQETTQR